MDSITSAPLSGVKVVDFGIFAAGPFCSVILGDLGADIIRVEPVNGDPLRGYYRGYNGVNRGKRLISLDMKSDAGRGIARQLCSGADVVTHNYRPGVSARLGIDPLSLHAAKPDIIVLEAPGYGTQGPKIAEPAFDMVLQGYAGHEGRFGGEGNFPLWYRHTIVDLAGGMLGALAVSQGLFRRLRTGKGAAITVSLLDAAIFLLSELVQDAAGRFSGADMLNSAQTGFHPSKSLYQTADGWVALVVMRQVGATRLAARLSLSDALSAPVDQWGDDERSRIAQAVRNRTICDLVTIADDEIWIEPCRTNAESELLANPILRSLGTVFQSPHPNFGDITQIGPLASFSRSTVDLSRRGHLARPGEHTAEILRELGYVDLQIAHLYQSGVVA